MLRMSLLRFAPSNSFVQISDLRVSIWRVTNVRRDHPCEYLRWWEIRDPDGLLIINDLKTHQVSGGVIQTFSQRMRECQYKWCPGRDLNWDLAFRCFPLFSLIVVCVPLSDSGRCRKRKIEEGDGRFWKMSSLGSCDHVAPLGSPRKGK